MIEPEAMREYLLTVSMKKIVVEHSLFSERIKIFVIQQFPPDSLHGL